MKLRPQTWWLACLALLGAVPFGAAPAAARMETWSWSWTMVVMTRETKTKKPPVVVVGVLLVNREKGY